MRSLWADRLIDAPAAALWKLLTDTEAWPEWGPSIRAVTSDSGRWIGAGATGSVTTAIGITLPFVVTRFADGRGWSWRVAGVAATDHSVEAIDADRCRVALGRLATMAERR